jgi:hypothetical protein
MSRFLTAEDVKKLTGYVMPSFQLKWCRNNGVQAWLSAREGAMVPVTAIEGRKADNDAHGPRTFHRFASRRSLCVPWAVAAPSTKACPRAST